MAAAGDTETRRVLERATKMRPEVLERIHQEFLKLGRGPTVELSRAEFETLFAQVNEDLVHSIVDARRESWESLFRLVDTNDSGGISFSEFCLWTSLLSLIDEDSDDDEALMNLIFDLLDTNHNGCLAPEEISIGLKKVLHALGQSEDLIEPRMAKASAVVDQLTADGTELTREKWHKVFDNIE
ncbi:hypothetical protein Pelo_7912 [Pelomyxa schiedti]|nr:hypothetical protein Pelo_7912 [Pelomyxa schiedti]